MAPLSMETAPQSTRMIQIVFRARLTDPALVAVKLVRLFLCRVAHSVRLVHARTGPGGKYREFTLNRFELVGEDACVECALAVDCYAL